VDANATECHLSPAKATLFPVGPVCRVVEDRGIGGAGAPRPTKMGTIASPWRYDCVIDCAIRPAALRRDYNLHHSLVRTGYESATDAGSSALSTMALKDNSFSL
jgi:hypothetical protein